MPIVLQCPACGSRYEVHDRLAGKQAHCQCGAVMKVPGPEPEPGIPLRQEQVDREPARPVATPSQPPQAPAEPDEDAPPAPGLAEALRELREQIRNRAVPLRSIVALLSILYGSIMALLSVAGVSLLGAFGCMPFAELLQPILAVLVAVGGVLMLKKHPQGTAWAGLSCALLCFLPICGDAVEVFQCLSAVRPGALLLVLLRAVLVYPIPIFIVVWTLREETARQADSEDDP